MLFQGTDPEKDRKYLWYLSCSKLFVIEVVAKNADAASLKKTDRKNTKA